MRLSSLFEDVRGPTLNRTVHRHLYHMTSAHGLAYSVSRDALRSLRHGYVSTTYDPQNNSFVGGDHANFKLILDGPKLAETYGVFDYDFHTTEIGFHGSRTVKSLNEREIGVNTKSIEPLRDFCEGVVLLRSMFSQTMVQDLLYTNKGYTGLFDVPKDTAPRGIEALMTLMNEWKLPVWIDATQPRPLNQQEQAFLREAWKVFRKGGDFRDGMKRLALLFPLKDHFGKELDHGTVKRLITGRAIDTMFNSYFLNRPVQRVNTKKVREIVLRAMRLLKLNSNIQAVIMDAAERAGLFHPTTPVVEWSIVFGSLAYGDIDGAVDAIKHVGERNRWSRERFDKYPNWSNFTHAGTVFTNL